MGKKHTLTERADSAIETCRVLAGNDQVGFLLSTATLIEELLGVIDDLRDELRSANRYVEELEARG